MYISPGPCAVQHMNFRQLIHSVEPRVNIGERGRLVLITDRKSYPFVIYDRRVKEFVRCESVVISDGASDNHKKGAVSGLLGHLNDLIEISIKYGFRVAFGYGVESLKNDIRGGLRFFARHSNPQSE